MLPRSTRLTTPVMSSPTRSLIGFDHLRALRFAHALHDDLLRRLGRNAPEFGDSQWVPR